MKVQFCFSSWAGKFVANSKTKVGLEMKNIGGGDKKEPWNYSDLHFTLALTFRRALHRLLAHVLSKAVSLLIWKHEKQTNITNSNRNKLRWPKHKVAYARTCAVYVKLRAQYQIIDLSLMISPKTLWAKSQLLTPLVWTAAGTLILRIFLEVGNITWEHYTDRLA